MKKIPQDVQHINKRIKKFRSFEKKVQNDPTETKFVYAYQIGARMGTELVSGVLIGCGLGYLLDKIFNSNPVMLIIFSIFGAAAGFVNMYRFVKQQDKRKE